MSTDSQLVERLAFLRIDASTRAILEEFLPSLRRGRAMPARDSRPGKPATQRAS